MKIGLLNTISITFIILLVIFIWGWYSSNLVLKVGGIPVEIDLAEQGPDFQDISFVTEDGLKISGLFVPAENSDITVIVCHGRGANKENTVPATKFIHDKLGVNLLYFDFRSHGNSDGNITTLGYKEMRELKAAIDFLKKEKKEYSKRIGVIGFSMGASVAIIAASMDERISAVVSDSAFCNMKDVIIRYARLYYGFPKFPLVDIALLFTSMRVGAGFDGFAPLNYIAKISPRPVLMIQGSGDLRMPLKEGRTLYEKAGEPKEIWIAEKSDHMNAYYDHTYEYETKVTAFFSKYLKKPIKSC